MSSIQYINSIALTSSAATISFANIPSYYQDLIIVLSMNAVEGANGIRLRLNDDSSANYSATFLHGNGSSAGSSRELNLTQMSTGWITPATTGDANYIEINIMSYSNTNVFKTLLINTGRSANAVESNVGLWRSTDAINKVTFAVGTSFPLYSLAAPTTATLWGVR